MRRHATIDCETDPFAYGEVPEAFAIGFYDGEKFVSFWGSDCVERMVKFLSKYPEPLIIFWHNGGKFDVFYFLQHLESDLRIVNGRIIQCHIGEHELRDSYAIMPFPLKEYQKTEIDYEKLHKDKRNENRDEIIRYLRDDCVFLHDLVTGFFREFGDGLTIGGTSMRQLKKFHTFKQGGEVFDAKFRRDFYYGGRNQVFKAGIYKGPVEIWDVNSMYSHVMASYLHPIGTEIQVSPRVEKNTCFVVVEGKNDGAFPVRRENNSLDFTIESGTFSVTIHEFEAALETGAFRPKRILKTFGFNNRITFAEFVEHFYHERGKQKAIAASAKKEGRFDKDAEQKVMFYKYVLNSAYGKFAQNPDNYSEWMIRPFGDPPPPFDVLCPVHSLHTSETCCKCWSPAWIHQGKYMIWQKPISRRNYYNVCTGASITGAARAVLLRGIKGATNPRYCDTDSLICESLENAPKGDSDLGSWKLEATGSLVAICGKKLYGVYTPESSVSGDLREKIIRENPDNLVQFDEQALICIKKAHKGARLSGKQILEIARGGTVTYENPVPKFRFDGTHLFTRRNIRRTA